MKRTGKKSREYVKPNQTIVEIGPGNGFYTDRFLPDDTKSYLVDDSEALVTNSCLINTRITRRCRSSTPRIVACLPSATARWTSYSLGVFRHIDIETIYGYLLESHRILRQDGIVVLQYASMVGDDAFQWYVIIARPTFPDTRCAANIHKPW